MEKLFIASTHNAPLIEFNENGNLLIQGRFISEDAIKTFEPMMNWISKYEGNSIQFTIDLDYLNTSATMQLFSLLRLLDENCQIEHVKVLWRYDEDDEDHLDTGEFFEDRLNRVEFEFEMQIDKDVA